MRRELVVGVFFFLALVILAWLTMEIDEEGALFVKPGKMYHARFANVAGLRKNDDVALAGMRVGKIASIGLEQGRGNVQELDVAFTVEEKFRVNVDCEAIIKTDALLGNKHLQITLGSPDAEELAEGAILKSSVSPGVDDILASISEIAASEDLRAIVFNINRIAEDLALGRGVLGGMLTGKAEGERFFAAMVNLEEITSDIRKGKGPLGKLLVDEELASTMKRTGEDIQAATASLKEIVSRLEKGKGLIARLLSDEALGEDLTHVAADGRDALASVKEIAAKVNAGEGTFGKLLEDDTLYTELVSSVTNLKDLTLKITTGDGSLARLINDGEIFDEIVRFIAGATEAIEDEREQAPITSFASVLLSAVQ